MYKVAIVDDNQYDLKDLVYTTKQTGIAEVIYSTTNAVDLFKWLHSTSVLPDIIIIDIIMDNMDGVITTLALNRQYNKIKTIAVSVTKNELLINQMLKAGAYKFISKSDFNKETIEELIIKVVNEPLKEPTLSSGYFSEKNKFKLTNKEIEYLTWLGNFLSDNEIADLMRLSIRSIDNCAKRVREKTNIQCKRELLKWSLQQGFSKIALYS